MSNFFASQLFRSAIKQFKLPVKRRLRPGMEFDNKCIAFPGLSKFYQVPGSGKVIHGVRMNKIFLLKQVFWCVPSPDSISLEPPDARKALSSFSRIVIRSRANSWSCIQMTVLSGRKSNREIFFCRRNGFQYSE